MNSSLVFLTVLSLAAASPAQDIKLRSTTLSEDLHEFVDLLPMYEISEIIVEYFNTDEQFQAALEYMVSDSFKNLVQAIDQIDEYIAFLNYLDKAGLDVYTYVNALHEILGLDKLPTPKNSNVKATRSVARITGGIAGLVADIKAILPTDEIAVLYEAKLVESPVFANFIAEIKSEEFQTIITALVTNEEYQKIRAMAVAAGVDVDAIGDLLLTIFGITV